MKLEFFKFSTGQQNLSAAPYLEGPHKEMYITLWRMNIPSCEELECGMIMSIPKVGTQRIEVFMSQKLDKLYGMFRVETDLSSEYRGYSGKINI